MYQASTTPCPKCGAQNLRGTWVCAQCGSTLMVYCPNCRAGNEAGSQYCRNCHTPLASPAQAAPPAQQQQQQPYPGYDQYQQYQQYPQYPQQGYDQQGQQQQYPGYDQQQPYQGYDPYQQYPGGYDPYGAYPPQPNDWLGKAQVAFDGVIAKVKQVLVTTNPILLSALVVLVVGMTVFLILAFQLGWIKTSGPAKTTTAAKDTSPVIISMLTIEQGSIKNSAIISWITNKYASTQVEYGIWPYANTTTPIENDPRTGANMGLMSHKVGLTNLLPKTSYVYKAISYDKDGNKGVSPEMRFDTTP